eukprot:CAMPEP_0170473946 /NCGR_PEP_ID=MMETSP0123-20130129/15777_1 /TAXON_ID=182087 /ORGANISM="Favella ehrenbergii, Strain Fehren 1" /LENGTH=156 /DNA_ID=CAMNT_0010743325 /DNA_START=337 /DNA_END=807 /DNA_ORIENTATION=-
MAPVVEVHREDTKPIFDEHRRKLQYPKTLEDHDDYKKPDVLRAKLDEVSMLKDIPVIKPDEVDQDLNKLSHLQYEPTFEHIVKRDIDKMEQTVSDEMKATLGIPRPHRKVQPSKSAKRIENTNKTAKHVITEQIARENMQKSFFDPSKRAVVGTEK